MDLHLASTSPRRRQLLEQAGFTFALCEPGVEHVAGEAAEPRQLALARARRKAGDAPIVTRDAMGGVPVLGVDTVVDLDGRELGKPKDRDAARAMLLTLAGRDHRVHTGHCLVPGGSDREPRTEVATATVRCRQPSPAELERYLESGQWQGKAGGYGIQDDEQGFLTLVDGPFDAVVGLHVEAVRRLLAASRS